MKSEDDIINELAEHVARGAKEDYLCGVEENDRSESPIERVMLAAFHAQPLENIEMCQANVCDPETLMNQCWSGSTDYIGQINQQVRLGNYRVDFYLRAFAIDGHKMGRHAIKAEFLRLVIECDGHDFHERTKEQARSDKRRDRWFQTRGISVLRFAGSEIWADPLDCVDQVQDAFFAAFQRYRGRE